MSSSASFPGVIPLDKLKIWEIFRDVGPEGEEILKKVKLAHVFSRKEAFVVTTADETYSFLRNPDVASIVCKIAKIPQLCGVRVKEFAVGIIELAMTEDGSLYSWVVHDPDVFYFTPDSVHFALLGRLPGANDVNGECNLVSAPHRVSGSLTGRRVQQVALAGDRAMALTESGDVHQWGQIFSSWEPSLVPKHHFHYQQVISIACSEDISVALTFNGELFQWEQENKVPKKVDVDTAPFKKITASAGRIFALTVHGALYSAGFQDSDPEETKPVWAAVFVGQEFQDIATSGNDDIAVFELKNNTRFAFSYHDENSYPPLSSFSQSSTSIDQSFAENAQATCRTICARNLLEPRTVGDDIADLWGSKENVDVTFSLEGKTISVHKLILTSRSEYFAKMFSNEWQETRAGSCIEMKDTKYDIFEALLFYLYHDKVKFGEDEYENIFGLMMLADAHCAVKIRDECEEILMRNITAENAVFLVRNAASANALDLEGKVVQFILDNRLLDVNLSPPELIDLLGMEAFHKISSASLRRM